MNVWVALTPVLMLLGAIVGCAVGFPFGCWLGGRPFDAWDALKR